MQHELRKFIAVTIFATSMQQVNGVKCYGFCLVYIFTKTIIHAILTYPYYSQENTRATPSYKHLVILVPRVAISSLKSRLKFVQSKMNGKRLQRAEKLFA